MSNKVALVTGASRGIGQAIAMRLAKNGLTVYGTATTEQGASRISEALNQYTGCKGLALDITQPESIEHAFSVMADEAGMPAILVNNAGITKDNLFMRMKDEEWQSVIDTNLSSVFRMSKACIRHMMKNRWGRIVTIGSVVGVSGNPGQANYCAAKAGVIGFSKSLAKEIASRGITVNVVAPGFIETDMTKNLNEEQSKAILGQIPMDKMGQPDDIAAAVEFLVSDAANYITGETIHVNGGMLMD